MDLHNHKRRLFKLSRAELSIHIANAVAAGNKPLAEALQDVYTIKRLKNQEARRRFNS
jgi:hypothetical protein